MIKCSPVRFLVEDVQLAERAPESCYPVDGQLIPRFLLQVVENLHGCEPFAFFALLRATEMAKEKFFQWVCPLEFPVVLLYDCFVSVVQPVAFTLHDVVHGLGIELAIIDSDVCLDGAGHFDANETAASRRVGQQVFQIAGPDEGGIAAHFLNSTTVGLSQVGNRFLQEVLQEALLIGVYLVEFVDVNQKKAAKAALRFLLALEVDTVGVAETQLRWQ